MSSDDIHLLIAEHTDRVRVFCRGKARSDDDADDLYQECMIALISSYARFAGRSDVSTWVYAVCRNVYSGFVYRRVRDRSLKNELQANPRAHASQTDPDLKLVIERLPSHQQTLYRLYYVEGYSVREVARLLERPEGTIKYLLHELRAALREILR